MPAAKKKPAVKKVTAKKTKTVKSIADAKAKVSDVEVFGNGDAFQLLNKASSEKEGWMKSTKAMHIPGMGCLVQVTTQQGDNVAEALEFVPGVKIIPINGDAKNGRMLVNMKH